MPSTLIGTVQNAKRTQGLVTSPAINSINDLIKIKGPGLFISAEISKQGGTSGLTFVEVLIDGSDIVSISYIACTNSGLTTANNYGLQISKSAALETITVGYQVPLTFSKELLVRTLVKEPGVVQILANTICAS